MHVTSEAPLPTIAGHTFAVRDRVGGLLNLRIDLHGAPLVALARALGALDGVRVTRGPNGAGPERCFVVHCLGFKMVLSVVEEDADFALALVSRTPQTTLAVMSELGSVLERLISAPLPVIDPSASPVATTSTARRRSALQQGKPLARRTQLTRRTPLARGRFKPS